MSSRVKKKTNCKCGWLRGWRQPSDDRWQERWERGGGIQSCVISLGDPRVSLRLLLVIHCLFVTESQEYSLPTSRPSHSFKSPPLCSDWGINLETFPSRSVASQTPRLIESAQVDALFLIYFCFRYMAGLCRVRAWAPLRQSSDPAKSCPPGVIQDTNRDEHIYEYKLLKSA